jgi:Kef-type K+ transport system membrane component KefB
MTATVTGDIALVILVASVLGALARRCGQPAVIGHILTGVLLGPSVLGHLPGNPTSHLFPHPVIAPLTALADLAVIVFIFTVGYETEFGSLREPGRAVRPTTVPLVAGGALAVPMGLGIGLVFLDRSGFAAVGEPGRGHSFVLFMGVAVSVTAMPVLAAIIRDRGLAGTTAGVIATAAAALMDVLAWLLLAAALIGTSHASRLPWAVTLVLIVCFAAAMLTVVRPALTWWTSRSQSVLANPVPVAFAVALGSAWVTTALGLQPIFGAFLAGLAMRGRGKAPDESVLRAMDQVGTLLLPLFFIVTGLILNIGGLTGAALILFVAIVAIASVGKLGPAYAMSRVSGLPPRQAATVAVLVNTRGLTELIALNTGLQDGLINQRLFTILVLMALLTTLATGLLLPAIKPDRSTQPAVPRPAPLRNPENPEIVA